MDPGVLAAACRHRRAARILLECISGGVTGPRLPAGAAEAGRKDRTSAGQGGKHGAVGMRPSAVCQGMVEVRHGLPGGPELGDERRDSARLRGAHARIGREWRRALEGVEALSKNVGRAPMRGVGAAL